ncbi:Hypothetical predicted protein [Octopus vulgaris]|uniref:Tubulin epsilon and delta complex protein 1 domain-containing protein n=1 Tax=Octopus vulgaris TaxID=6645 RepID=A0AA36AYF8_OCTVU|nr:Hypothetical predicted protein [Octopus vulgaris]
MEKKVIRLLTKILSCHGTSKIQAENFRLSKFNKPEAVVPMLCLLCDVIHIYKFGMPHQPCCNCELAIDSTKSLERIPDCTYLDFVQRELFKLGYKSCDLFSIPEDLSSGSRELLLALSWFISKIDFMSILLEKHFIETTDQINIDINDKQVSNDRVTDQLKYLVMINNKIRMTSRLVHALQQECNSSVHHLHKETQMQCVQSNMNHLTMQEAKMLRSEPEKLLKKLESDNATLQDLLLWREQEDIFWNWMKTVLALKMQSVPEERADPKSSMSLTSKDCQFLVEAKTNLEKALLPYNDIICDLDRLWIEKKLQLCERDLNELAKELDLEIDQFHKKHSILYRSRTLQPQQHCYFYASPHSIDAGNQASGSKQFTKKHLDEGVGLINDQIKLLENLIYDLDEKIVLKQESYQKQINQVASQFKEFACIPVSPS